MAVKVVVPEKGEFLRDVAEHFFQRFVYVRSNEDLFFKYYRPYVEKAIGLAGKGRVAIIGGGDVVHLLMAEMVKAGDYSDMYLVDANPKQIEVEMAKLRAVGTLKAEEFFTGGLDMGEYEGFIDPVLGSDLQELAGCLCRQDGYGWTLLEPIKDGVARFVEEAENGKRDLYFVLENIGDFIEDYVDRIGLIYLSNVQEWKRIPEDPNTPIVDLEPSLELRHIKLLKRKGVKAFGCCELQEFPPSWHEYFELHSLDRVPGVFYCTPLRTQYQSW